MLRPLENGVPRSLADMAI